MSYMRGKYYLWKGGDGVHLWAYDGEDHWKDSGWAEGLKPSKAKRGRKPSGVCIPRDVLDEFVVMRFAELIDERKVRRTIRNALKKWRGNGGAVSVTRHGKQIIGALRSIKPDPERLRFMRMIDRGFKKSRGNGFVTVARNKASRRK
jgi:hypothetical protein